MRRRKLFGLAAGVAVTPLAAVAAPMVEMHANDVTPVLGTIQPSLLIDFGGDNWIAVTQTVWDILMEPTKFHGPMTPDDAPPIATRHLCYGGLFGGGGGGGGYTIIQQAPPVPVYEPMPAPVLPAPVAPPPVYDVPEVVAPPPVPVMPIADPQASKREEMRKLAVARSKRTTRQSTIIGDDALGG